MWLVRARDGVIVDVNAAAVGFYGGDRSALLASKVWEIDRQGEGAFFETVSRVTREGGREWLGPLALGSGAIRQVAVSWTAVEDLGETFLHAILHDVTEHGMQAAEVARSKALLNATLESSADGLLVVDREGIASAFNRRFVEMWGIPETLLANPEDARLLEFVLNQLSDPDAFLKKVRDLYALPEAESFDTLVFQDGRVFERYSRPERLDGHVVGRVWSFRDVTARARSETALRESEARYRTLTEQLRVNVWQKDRDGRYVSCNRRYAEALGFTPETIIGHRDEDFYPADLAAKYRADDLQVIVSGRPLEAEERWTDGVQERWLHTTKVPLVDAQGQGIGSIGIGRDITERKKAEEALRASEERWRTIVQNEPECVKVLDLEGRLLEMNPAGLAMIQATFEQVAGRPVGEMVAEEDRPAFDEMVAAVFRGETRHLVFDMIGLERRRLTLETTSVPLRETTGTLVVRALLGVTRDVTERKRAEEALRESEEKYRGLFNNAGVAMFRTRLDGSEFLDMNEKFLEIFDFQREELQGMPSVLRWADPRERDAMVRELLAAGHVAEMECRMVNRKGKVRTCLTSLRLYRDAGILEGSITDVTEKKRAEEALRDSERALREAQALGRMGSYVYDFPSDAWSSSEVLDGIFGIDATYVRNFEGWLELVDVAQREEMAAYFQRLVAEHARFDRDYRIVRRSDGEERWVHGLGVLEYAADGSPRRLYGTIQDITERKRDEERLKRAAAVFSSSREGFVITNDKGEVEEINEAFAAITGYDRTDMIGRNMRFLQSGRHDHAFYQEMWQELVRTGQWQGEIWNRRKDGTIFPEWLSISVVRGERSRVAGYVGVFSDISTLKATEEKLEHLARHDPLTDLPNRLLLASYLGQAVSRSRRSGRSGAVLFLDLDRFKNVNDSLGHAAGDEILQSTARLLRERLRDGDLIARLGGDEFIVLLEDIDGPQAAAAVAIDLIDRFRHPFLLGNGREVYVGLSIGISVFPADGDRTEVLIQNADAALYEAKERGRSTFRFYSEALTVAANERLALESELRRGLALDQFLLHYQPVVRLADGRIEGVEALLRWQSPERGLVMPSSFIGVAEETGLIVPLGEEVLRRSCRQMRSWLDAGLPFGTMAVNVSPRQLLQQDLELRVEAILAETGLEAGYLELEITESAIMEQGAEAEARLAAIKSLGVRLAIDDFGTGYSSLSHLRRFPIDTFKIDRSFIGNVPDDRTQREIVLTIISLARQLGLHVVAEGVETERQVAFLRENACDSAQGHFFNPAVPADRIAAIVRS